MAEKKQVTKIVDPMVAFVDLEGDPETEIAKREAELKAKGQDGPTKGATGIGLKEGSGGEQDLPEQTPESPETEIEAEARDEGPEEEEAENPEGLEATEPDTQEKPQKRPWERVKEMRKELKEERKAREALESRLAQYEARQQAIDQQRAQYIGQGQRAVEEQAQQQAPQIPAYEEDPLGNLSYRLAVAEQRNTMSEQEILMQRVVQRVGAEEQEYTRQAPDYAQARDWAIQREWAASKAMGLDDNSALMNLQTKRQIMIAAAWQNGKSIGQAVYEYARAMGYPGIQQEQPGGNGKAQDDTAQERVRQAAAREKQASASLGSVPNTPGRTGGNRLTRARVMAMTQEEMDKMSDNDPNWMERVEM